MDLAGFDASQGEEWRDNGGLIPDCEVLAVIDQSEEKATKSGNGSYLELRWEIIEGPYNGRKLWERLNLKNPSEKAVKIAESKLRSICRAVGVITPNVAQDLHDRPHKIKVRSETDDSGKTRNVIGGWSAPDGIKGTPAAVPPNVKIPESAQKKKPWEKKAAGWQPKEPTPF